MFGGSGPVGAAVLRAMRATPASVTAVSRAPQVDGERLQWRLGSFEAAGDAAGHDVIVSCGPLDLFAAWYVETRPRAARVIAFGSTSVTAKVDSPDPDERALAARLAAAEAQVFDTARALGADATLLRPTLVYGDGRERNLALVLALADRLGCFVLPSDANGLRQPVHVDDLAAAVMAALDAPASAGRAYALPGGETLAYADMVRRVLAVRVPAPRLLRVPAWLFRGLLGWVRRRRGAPVGEGAVARLREDLAFDDAPARRDLGWSPRAFHPTAGMFPPKGAAGTRAA